MIDQFWQDLRQAWRSLHRARAFSAAVAATFALGMAGAISMFALIEGILLRPLAVPNEDQLVVGWRQLSDSASARWPFRTMDIDTLRAGSRRLESIAGQPPKPGEILAGCAFAPRCPRQDAHCRAVRPDLVTASEGRAVACHRPITAPVPVVTA